jgi:hypothetical protein
MNLEDIEQMCGVLPDIDNEEVKQTEPLSYINSKNNLDKNNLDKNKLSIDNNDYLITIMEALKHINDPIETVNHQSECVICEELKRPETKWSFNRIKQIITDNKGKGHEIIRGPCLPYYDFEIVYENVKEGKSKLSTDYNEAYEQLRQQFVYGRIISFVASGIVMKDNVRKWKQSFHFIVRGDGYYKQGADIPKMDGDGWDQSVYKRAGKRQCFRLPYCSKDGETRKLLLIDPEDNNPTMPYQSVDEAEQITGLNYDEWLITNTLGETLKIVFNEEQKDEINNINHKSGGAVELEKLNYLLDGICVDGGQDLDWETWIKTIWAIVNVCVRSGHDYNNIAIEFSKKSNKFNLNDTKKAIQSAINTINKGNKKLLGMKWLIDLAQKINPEQFIDWRNKYGKTCIDLLDGSYCYLDLLLVSQERNSVTYYFLLSK